MIYRNKLGTFSFDDNVQESHMKLIVQTITGQYLAPKPREPELTDEQSCYDYILSGGGQVLAAVPFDLEINEDVRVYTKAQLKVKKIKDFDEKIEKAATAFKTFRVEGKISNAEIAEKLHIPESVVRPSFGGWLVGPAAVKQ